MTDRLQMLGDVTGELVLRGIPRYDHNPESRSWLGSDNCWWIHRPPSNGEGPQALLCCEGTSDDGHHWRFEVETCCCCDVISSLELVDDGGGSIASFPWWPGLDAVINLHRQISGLWLAELEREEAT